MLVCQSALAETLRQATPLEQLFKEAAVSVLVEETILRGDPSRGAILFHKSAAACGGSMLSIERSNGEELAEFIAASVQGDIEGLRWEVDSQKRLVLTKVS